MSDRHPEQYAPIAVGGRAAHQLLAGALPELVRTVLGRCAEEAEWGGNRSVRLADEVDLGIRGFIGTLLGNVVPTVDGLAAVRDSAARRAAEGMALETVLKLHHLAVEVCGEFLENHVDRQDAASLRRLNRLQLGYLGRVAEALSTGYLSERRLARTGDRSAQQALLTALLAGTPAAEAAGRAALKLPASYFVLQLSIRVRTSHSSPEGQRCTLKNELEQFAPGSVLTALSTDGGVVLLPSELHAEEVDAAAWTEVSKAVTEAAASSGVEVIAGAEVAEPDGVAPASGLARDVLDLALRFDRAPGVHRLDHLLLEYQLTRRSPARTKLAALLDPLRGKAGLLETVRVHVSGGLNRRGTAEALHIHPNTVDYRLRKIATLTGMDITNPADLPRMIAALAAHTAERGA